MDQNFEILLVRGVQKQILIPYSIENSKVLLLERNNIDHWVSMNRPFLREDQLQR